MELQTVIKNIQRVPPAKLDKLNKIIEDIIAEDTEWKVPEWGFGALKGTFHMADDFDEPLEDFKDYM